MRYDDYIYTYIFVRGEARVFPNHDISGSGFPKIILGFGTNIKFPEKVRYRTVMYCGTKPGSRAVKAETAARLDVWPREDLKELAARVVSARLKRLACNRSKKAKIARRAATLLRHT
jgi:hypothetical protein